MNTVCFNVSEGMLTGEAKGIYKDPKALNLGKKAIIAAKSNMLFSATFVNKGSGLGLVTAIGEHTEVGKIGSSVKEAKEEE